MNASAPRVGNMYIVRTVKPEFYLDYWRKWESFRPDDPTPTKLSVGVVLVDLHVLDYEPTKVIGFFSGDDLLGGTCVYARQARGMTIGGIGRMAVEPTFRRNRIASHLVDVCLTYMFRQRFEISVLWASVLALYENFGYVPLTSDHRETNMMYRPISGLPVGWTKQQLLDLPSRVGVW